MGVISITQRSESLGNIRSSGTPKRAKTDIGTVQRARRPVYTPTFFAQHSHGGDAAIGDAIKQAAGIALAIGQREDERQADKISQAVMSNLDRMDRDDRDIDDWNAPDRKHLEGQKRGLLLRTGEGCKNLPQEADDSYGDTFKKIADSIGATDKQREMASERLYGYRRARQNRMMDLQSSEYRRIELDGAAGQLEQFVASWKNGNTGVLEDIFTAQERLGILKGKTEDTRKAERGNLAVVLASDLVRNKLNGCASDEDFDTLEKAVRKGPEEFMPVEIASRLPDGKLGGKAQDALVDEIRREKRVFRAERDAEEREARQAVGRSFTEKELALRDVPQELWADAYESMGKDPTLRKADPKRAMSYMDAASELRTAATKAKEKASADAIKGNEENLARSLATFDLLKMEGTLSQDDANDAQAAIWRKFRALSLGKQLSPSFMRSFETRLSSQLSDQEANAMRKFYQAFGFSTELDKGGEPTATARRDARKDSENYYAPLEEDGVKLESRKTRVKAADLLTYGDTLLRTLRALGPDINREGVVEREIARLKTGWLKGELDKNRDATVRSVMDMQRETRTRWEMAQPDKRSEEDDGRREDGESAK